LFYSCVLVAAADARREICQWRRRQKNSVLGGAGFKDTRKKLAIFADIAPASPCGVIGKYFAVRRGPIGDW
jgi:hypothetical protein